MKNTPVLVHLLRWFLGVVGAAATALVVSVLLPVLKNNLVDTYLPQLADAIRNWATYPVPAWFIAASVAGFLLLRWIVKKVVKKANPDAELFAYTTDTFGPWHFHWVWSRDRFGRRTIRNLSLICSVHDLALVKKGSALVCPKCGRSFPALDRTALDHFRETIAKKAAAK